MNVATSGFRILIRIAFLIELALGLLFWSGNAVALVPVHQLLGLLLVLGLWGLAVTAAIARVPPAVVALSLAYGLVVPVVGELQDDLVPGSAHWTIQAVHLLIGLGLVALAEWLGLLIRRRQASQLQSIGDAQ
jgi:hypothetical protein